MMFGRKKNKQPDDLLRDLPRGVKNRPHSEGWLPAHFFEDQDAIAARGFEDHSDNIFLGVVGGVTELVKRSDGRSEYITQGGQMIGIKDDRHMITVAGSRAGKGRSSIIPNLLTYAGSVVCIDPKGENANVTANYRRDKLGQNVYILDPFGITDDSLKTHRISYNPLTTLHPTSYTIIEDAGMIADSIIVPNNGKDAHWDMSAKSFLETVILHVCTSEMLKPEERNLCTVADIITGKLESLDTSIKHMLANGSIGGQIAAGARVFVDRPAEEKGSVLSTLRRHIKFLDYLSIRETLEDHDFDLDELKSDKVSIYVCLPSMRLGSCRSFLRMMINLTLGTMDSVLEKPPLPVLVILDEFPVLGYMKDIEDAAGQIAGFGVKLWVIVQDLSQLKALYKERWETFLGNTGIIEAFGNVDHFTLSYLSKLLGTTTMITSNKSAQSRAQTNEQGASGYSEQEKTVALLSETEISQYFSREDPLCRKLVILPGSKPWILSRTYYDQYTYLLDKKKR